MPIDLNWLILRSKYYIFLLILENGGMIYKLFSSSAWHIYCAEMETNKSLKLRPISLLTSL